MDNGLDTWGFGGNREPSLLIEKNDLVKGGLFVAFDQDAVTLFQSMSDRTFFKGVVSNDSKMFGVINSNDTSSSLLGAGCIFPFPVD